MMKPKQQQQQQQTCNNIDNDLKSHLVIDTCNIYQNSHFSCIHHHNINNNDNHNYHHKINLITPQSLFIDWYLILRVAEDASISTIRKQYRKLALLLHPDKNKHPKAEFAFKLISQAYKCLSDDAKRIAFNLERWRNQCTTCSRIPHNIKTHTTFKADHQRNSPNSPKKSRSYRIQQHFRSIRERIIEETRVIEGCIRINQQRSKTEYPVFDPSSYARLGYPHTRNHQQFYKKSASVWEVQTRNVVLNYDHRRGRCESPIFELRTNSTFLKINSACVSS